MAIDGLPFSRRYPWAARPNRVAEALSRAQSYQDLMITNPLRAGLALPTAELARGVEARQAVSRYYAEEQGARVEPEQVQLTASTSEGYSFCFKMIADAGERILLPQPSYPLLEHLVRAEGLEGVGYPLHYAAGEWVMDRRAVEQSWDGRTRGIVVVEPNNPTGSWLREEDRQWLGMFTRGRGWVLSDEVFADYAWQERLGPPLARQEWPNALVLSGLSKICALPQMKLGWVLMPAEPEIWRRMELIADTWLSVSGPTLEAAGTWLEQRREFQTPVQQRCRECLEVLAVAVAGTDWDLLPVEAGWSAVLRGPNHVEEERVVLELLERGYLAHPGYYYDLPFATSVVVSLLTPPESLRAGLATLISSGK